MSTLSSHHTSYNSLHKSSRYLLRKNYFKTLSKILSDESYICPTFKLIEYLTQKTSSNVYLYAFNYRSSSTRLPENYGVVHGKEREMIFGHPLLHPEQKFNFIGEKPFRNYSEQDRQLSRDIIKRYAVWNSRVLYQSTLPESLYHFTFFSLKRF
jgi:carboxylesterase type B